MTLSAGANEFERLKDKIWEDLDALYDQNPASSSHAALLSKMYEHLGSARRLDVLRVYDRFLTQQKNLFSLYMLQRAIQTLNEAYDGDISSIFHQVHLDHASGFDFGLRQAGEIFPGKAYREYHRYLDALHAAAILSPEKGYNYLIQNVPVVCGIAMDRNVTDPKTLVEIINVMADGGAPLAKGTL